MPRIGPGYDEPEYDNYDPTWEAQNTPFRQWLFAKLENAGFEHADEMATSSAPANRYNGLDDLEIGALALLTRTSPDEVRAAHKADIAEWQREQQLRTHPDLAVLDATLDHIAHRH
ncbi:hypothetical protein [Streptomyces huasconensis]|uniref:hypothetical protein n=1 Tax=Streptomyces huasconensis TaxID=1854574 RepID=UPI0037027B43